MNNRIDKIVDDVANAIASALAENNVTRGEYRHAINYLGKVAEAKEIGLFFDVFLEHLVIKNQDRTGRNSAQAIQGPYFLEDIPWVDGKLKVMAEDNGEPLQIRATVKDPDGRAVPDATVFIWHSTPDGAYSKFHRDLPADLYRGRVKTDSDGRFEVETTMPVPYSIPNKGPTGALLEMMGRHTMRPAHVHFKIRKEGFAEHTTQAYFEGGEWVDNDVAGGIVDALIFKLDEVDGIKALKIDFVLEPAQELAHTA